MSTTSELDLKELKDLINRRFDELKAEGAKMSEQIKNLEIGQGEIKGRLAALESSSQKIPDLAEKVGELKNWKQIGLTLIGAILGGIITYFVKNHNI